MASFVKQLFRGQTLLVPKTERLHGFAGGIHPPGQKQTDSAAIEIMPPPRFIYLPLHQHAGRPSRTLVREGQRVLKGQLLAAALDRVSAPVHASTSGIIVDVGQRVAPHPSGLPTPVIIIESDGKDEWIPADPPLDPLSLPSAEIARRVEDGGVVGLGGAAFPAAVKLRQASHKVHTLIINAAECEPYLTCDDRVMRERALGVVDGIRLMLRALAAERALIGIEDNKPEAAEILHHAVRAFPDIKVVVVPTRFPTGSSKQLVRLLTGQEVPAHARSHEVGIVMHNVSTAFAIHRAVRRGRPLVSRVVTVAGGAIAEPKNVDVPLGTPMAEVIRFCGGVKGSVARFVMGGPMTGIVVADLKAPVVKATTGLLALTPEEVGQKTDEPCIRCARCVQVCPMGLLPMEMGASARAEQWQVAVEYGLADCIECGSCAYVCPSHIPLLSYFVHAKGELRAQSADEQRATMLKARSAEKEARETRIKEEKKAAALARAQARKAARAAQAAKKNQKASSLGAKES